MTNPVIGIASRMQTPKGLRLHIGLFGRRNAGKSSLINALTNQKIAIVSDVPGTTTDPVEKACELAPIGPVVFIDTAGIDDVGELGGLRTERSLAVLGWVDVALIVCDAKALTESELELIGTVKSTATPAVVVLNKADTADSQALTATENQVRELGYEPVTVCASQKQNIDAVREAIVKLAQSAVDPDLPLLGDLVHPGDTVMGMSLADGGHLTHGMHLNFSGRYFNIVSYGVRDDTEAIDYDEVERLAKEHQPKLIIAGASAYSLHIDFKRFADIAHSVGAILMTDIAHYAGLVAAGVYPSPFGYADVVTTTTHKSLRGPRGGIIFCRPDLEKKINSAVFPGTQGGPLMHVIAGKAVALGEALKPEFKEYGKQVIKNAEVLAKTLMERGLRIVSGGTQSHVMLVDLRPMNLTGKAAEALLGAAHITVNKNAIHNDPQTPFVTSGIRLGTPAMTTRGFKEEETRKVANLIADLLSAPEDAQVLERVRTEVNQLTAMFPVYRP